MITINGKKYVKNDKEFTDTLFHVGGTATGFYKKLKNSIELYDMQNNLVAAIVVNTNKFTGIVNATKTSDGKKFFQHDISGKWRDILGVPNGYSAQRDYAEWLYKKCNQEHLKRSE